MELALSPFSMNLEAQYSIECGTTPSTPASFEPQTVEPEVFDLPQSSISVCDELIEPRAPEGRIGIDETNALMAAERISAGGSLEAQRSAGDNDSQRKRRRIQLPARGFGSHWLLSPDERGLERDEDTAQSVVDSAGNGTPTGVPRLQSETDEPTSAHQPSGAIEGAAQVLVHMATVPASPAAATAWGPSSNERHPVVPIRGSPPLCTATNSQDQDTHDFLDALSPNAMENLLFWDSSYQVDPF